MASKGFAHSSLTLQDNVHVLLAGNNTHSEENGVGVAWNDPELAIPWPLIEGAPIVIAPVHAAYGSFAAFRRDVGGV
jgi:dTDP-4-dehydrorhamnose 3,5-epimerase